MIPHAPANQELLAIPGQLYRQQCGKKKIAVSRPSSSRHCALPNTA